jgi:predicted DNA-binding transcriptional regulator AlpA
MKTKETPASLAPEESALTDALAPALLTEKQAAAYVGETPHQLYKRRSKGTGPPFVMFGARVRYRPHELKQWVAELPTFTSRAEALVANPARADGARRQRATTAQARQARQAKRRAESAKKRDTSAKRHAKPEASASSESANSDA